MQLCSYAITASQFALGPSRKLATVAEDEGYVRLKADLKTPTQIGENFYGPRTLYSALQDSA
jgi:hypothetical protein